MKHALLALCLAPATLLAADLPDSILPEGVGVNIHFTTGHEQDLDLIAAGGFKFIRMDFHWSGIERKPGEYDWSDYDELTANLEQRGLRPIYIFDYSNPLYEETITVTNKHMHKAERALCSPQHPESVAAFARWAGAAAAHFRGRRIVWEIWNEPNIHFWRPKPDVQHYTTLALATVKAVRAADPQATIIAPGSSCFPWSFFEELFASGILHDLDAVSVHPYRNGPPETAAADYLKLRALIARHAPPEKRNLPIISGEWGYSTPHKGLPLATQAAYLARQQLANLLAGVPLSIWYDWKNDGSDTNYNVHNFGTMTRDLRPKLSYRAVQALTRELAGYHVACRLETADTNDWVLLCIKRNGAQKLAMWTLAGPHTTTLELTEKKLALELDAAPNYQAVTPPDPRLALMAAWSATPQPDVLVSTANRGKVVLRIQASNPLTTSVAARFSVEGFDSGKTALVLDLPANGQARGELSGNFQRRDREELPVVVRAQFRFTPGVTGDTAVESVIQRIHFIRADPLWLTLMPVANGLRALIENPGLTAFSGNLQLGENKVPVLLATDAKQINIELPKSMAPKAILTDEHGVVVAEVDVPRRAVQEFTDFRAVLEGEKTVPAKAHMTIVAAPGPAAPCANAFKLDYELAAGGRFVRCVPTGKPPVAIAGRPQAFGIWVYGDKAGNHLNVRVTDASGQTFQINGPAVDWSGWRWVVFPIGELLHASHWSGANDGKVHGALRWNCPLLLDSTRHSTTGTIYFAGLTLLDVQP